MRPTQHAQPEELGNAEEIQKRTSKDHYLASDRAQRRIGDTQTADRLNERISAWRRMESLRRGR